MVPSEASVCASSSYLGWCSQGRPSSSAKHATTRDPAPHLSRSNRSVIEAYHAHADCACADDHHYTKIIVVRLCVCPSVISNGRTPVSCRMASPVESCPGDVNYTSRGTPSINDVRPARRDNVRPRRRRERPSCQRKRRQGSTEVTCTNYRRYVG